MAEETRPAGPLDAGFLPFERRLLERSVGGQRGFLLLRLILGAVLLLQTLNLDGEEPAFTWPAAVPALYAAAAALLYRRGRSRRPEEPFAPAVFLLDVATALLVFGATGGPGVHVFIGLLLLILSGSFLKRPILIFSVGISVCLGYAVLAFSSETHLPRVLPGHVALFLLITLFAVHIADYASVIERQTARRYEEKLAWLQRLSLVGRAMAAVLHEAKTPLGTIVLNAESAESQVAAGRPPREELRVISAEAEHATTILQNFLDFVRPTQLERQPLHLHEPLQQAAEMLKIRLAERGVSLAMTTRDDCRVLGSPRHLLQAFTNIMNNAVEAMPSGGKLAVSMERGAGRALVRFRDDGVGMSAAALERLFEPFSTSKASEEGHGLGLSIVRWIAHEHQGDVRLSSAGSGRGTEVVLELPLAEN